MIRLYVWEIDINGFDSLFAVALAHNSTEAIQLILNKIDDSWRVEEIAKLLQKYEYNVYEVNTLYAGFHIGQ